MNRCTVFVFIIGLLLIKFIKISLARTSGDVLKPKIAIIGAGIGGASTSHFLTELLDGNLEIDIFEANQVGGRLATIDIDDNLYEAGGSIIDSRNKYMKDFIELLGLEKRPTSNDSTEITGIWNGDEFVFTDSEWTIVTLIKLLLRYGFQPLTLYSHVSSIQDSFNKIYEYQDEGRSYDTVVDLISAMSPELSKLLETPTAEYFKSLGFSDSVINELIEATLVVNYGQNTDVHGMVGCVSIIAAGSNLWAVKGGNKEVPTHLIYRNNKVNVIPSQVTTITHLLDEESHSQYEISYKNKGSNNLMKNTYDIVVIAAPMTTDQKSSIEFLGFPENKKPQFQGSYQTTIATFVHGDLNPNYFGLEQSIGSILSCDPNKTLISSVGELSPVNGPTENNTRVWKIFTREPLTSSEINSMFTNVEKVQVVPWKAYPKYSANSRSDKFILYDWLYHVNAIEWAASAMEMSAIGGRNVALLIHNKIDSCCQKSFAKCKYSCKRHNAPQSNERLDL